MCLDFLTLMLMIIMLGDNEGRNGFCSASALEKFSHHHRHHHRDHFLSNQLTPIQSIIRYLKCPRQTWATIDNRCYCISQLNISGSAEIAVKIFDNKSASKQRTASPLPLHVLYYERWRLRPMRRGPGYVFGTEGRIPPCWLCVCLLTNSLKSWCFHSLVAVSPICRMWVEFDREEGSGHTNTVNPVMQHSSPGNDVLLIYCLLIRSVLCVLGCLYPNSMMRACVRAWVDFGYVLKRYSTEVVSV